MAERARYLGPALFSFGFRPFFLVATLFGAGVVPAWLLVWQGRVAIDGPFAPVDWHVHEMIFGYAAAVIAGYLFTAVPNWTGRMPTRGWPLMVLVGLWLLGRLAVAGLLPLGRVGVAAADCALLLAILAMVLVEIVAGRNWRNLKVAVPVGLLFIANLLFHVEAMNTGSVDFGRRAGLAVVVFLIAMIGGRIIPSFTRNWLAQRRAARMPVPFGRFDGLCVGVAAVALAAWVVLPRSPATAVLLAGAGLLHLARLARWRGPATWRSALLLMLHIAYLFVPLGLLATAGAAAGRLAPGIGEHLLGIGAIGGMTTAVMARTTRGHTGRGQIAGPMLGLAFALVVAAALVRVALPRITFAGVDGVTIAAALWTGGYALLALRIAPWLARPAPARRRPNRAP